MNSVRVNKIAKKIKFEGVWGDLGSLGVSGGNRSRGGWGWLWFPCGIAHCGFHKVVSEF